MVKKAKKVDRTDKWYVLAKEQGYRSRAAFKLAQINKEYAFLNAKTKVVLDLCAAPGGWAQIAAKCVPQDAAIIAVDLLPIKPIPRVRCIVGDITTQQTRDVVKREVKNAGHQNVGVDVVLCDGAPNVGTQYTKDAFVQNEISLLALRCGIDCGLRRGGTFCTKVYRSQDYNALLWAFGRLFEKVKAFKPAASRVQSAEIFVVCEGYLKPDKVDAKLLDPKHVFSDVDGPNSAPAGGPALVYAGDRPLSVLHPQWGKKQRHRVGYDERNTGILELGKISARDFVDCKEPAQMLAERSQIVFEGGGLANHPATKPEVLACAADLRLLARSDFRQLLKWRERVLKSEKAVAEPAAQGEEAQPEEAEDIDSEDDMQNQILNARETLQQDARRAKKRLARQAGKERDRRAAGISDGHGMIVGHEDDEIFSFSKAAAVGGVDGIGHAEVEEEEEEAVVQRSGAVKRKKGAEEYESARERDLAVEDQLDVAYDEYASRRSLKSSAPREEKTKLSKKKRSNVASQIMQEDSMLMEGDVEQYAKQLRAGDSDSSDDSDASDDDNEAPAASRWFSRPIFDSLAAMPDSQLDADGLTKMPLTDKQQRAEKRKKASERNDRKLKKQKDKLGDEDFEMELAPKAADGKGKSTRADPKKVEPSDDQKKLIKAGLGLSSGDARDASPFEVVAAGEEEPQAEMRNYMDSDESGDDIDTKAQGLALATMMLRRNKAKKMVDASYNRFAWNDPKDLPSWFVDDEKRHYRPQLEMKPELVAEMKKRFVELSNKPIKKVAEARQRKKGRADARLDAAKKKADSIANDTEMSARQKLKAVQSTLAKGKRGLLSDKKSKVYVVAKKTSASGASTSKAKSLDANKGSKVVKVDGRMKMEKRAAKNKVKRGPKRKRS